MNKDEVELFRLHTSKAYRRKGYATKLVDLVCLLYQLSPIKLRVGGNEEINSNDLMNFYSTFGFVRVGESKTMIKQ
jgi:ribosomal protein S18 acetylase RimI-like enzyme